MFAGINPFSNFANIYIERKEEARRGGIAFFAYTAYIIYNIQKKNKKKTKKKKNSLFWQHRASEKMAEDFKH